MGGGALRVPRGPDGDGPRVWFPLDIPLPNANLVILVVYKGKLQLQLQVESGEGVKR